MAIDNLFQRIKNSVRSQKSNFCSTSTSVTLLGSGQFIPLNLVVNYTDCDGIQRVVPYGEVVMNNNFIPDCVQGGGPISITNGDETTSTLSSDINEGDVLIEPKPIEPQQSSYKIFVQYGTTPCVTPPPSTSIILIPCNLISSNFIVDPTGYNLIQGEVYQMSLNPLGPVPIPVTQCYTVGEQTNQQASYNITGMISQFIDCKACDGPSPSPPTPTPTVTPPMVIAYIVGNTSYKNQIDACASSGGGTITVYSNSALQVNTTFLYTDSLLTTPYNSEGFVYYSGKSTYVLSTGPDGKLTSLSPCT